MSLNAKEMTMVKKLMILSVVLLLAACASAGKPMKAQIPKNSLAVLK